MENTRPVQKLNPPYLLGLLCLLPLVGAFVGLGLLLYGVIRYKDKWLSIMGIFGIAFSLFAYSLLLNKVKQATIFKNGFSDISQMQLNNLVKYVEFYKLQYGTYPDSLSQLLDDDKLAPIHDPLQFNLDGKNSNYNYAKIGENYALSSSGKDGIPDTKDDFYPQIVIKDSSKIGLIRVK